MTTTSDVFVYGATPASIFSAIVCARAGKTVVLLAPESGLGGMITGGLGITDAPLSFKNWAGGVVEEFTDALAARTNFDALGFVNWNFAPSDALTVFEAMVTAETNITRRMGEIIQSVSRNQVVYSQGMLVGAIADRGSKLASVTTADDTYHAQVFIDGSYNGELMAAAGVKTLVGREAASYRDEPRVGAIAGVQTTSRTYPGVDGDGDLNHYAGWRPLEPDLTADRRFMALGYRNCLTNIDSANNLGFPAPPGYDDADFQAEIQIANETTVLMSTREQAYSPIYRTSYDAVKAADRITGFAELNERNRQERWWRSDFEASGLSGGQRLANMMLEPDKFATNGSDIRGTLAHEYATADEHRRAEIRDQLAYRELGRLHTYQTHPDVPLGTRNSFAAWGLCADEWQTHYTLIQGWPSEIYERTPRRLIGQAQMDFWSNAYQTNWPDQIAVGSYFMDSKAKSIWAMSGGGVEFEGDYDTQPFFDANGVQIRADTYNFMGVPMGAVVAPRGSCDNLLVCWGISSTEIAHSAIRLEPFLSAVGEAVGHIAIASLNADVPPARIDYQSVRSRLDAAGLTIYRWEPVA